MGKKVNDVFRIAVTVGWQAPILPDWSDRRPGGMFARRNFYRWIIDAHIDRSGGGSSLSSCRLLGFYVTIFVTDFWPTPGK